VRAIRTTLCRASPGAPRDARLGAVTFLHRFGAALETLRKPSQNGGFNFGGGGAASLEQDILRLVKGDTGGRRRRRGGGGLFPTRSESAPMAEPGIYTMILKIGDRTLS
jgi:hypothetical protein